MANPSERTRLRQYGVRCLIVLLSLWPGLWILRILPRMGAKMGPATLFSWLAALVGIWAVVELVRAFAGGRAELASALTAVAARHWPRFDKEDTSRLVRAEIRATLNLIAFGVACWVVALTIEPLLVALLSPGVSTVLVATAVVLSLVLASRVAAPLFEESSFPTAALAPDRPPGEATAPASPEASAAAVAATPADAAAGTSAAGEAHAAAAKRSVTRRLLDLAAATVTGFRLVPTFFFSPSEASRAHAAAIAAGRAPALAWVPIVGFGLMLWPIFGSSIFPERAGQAAGAVIGMLVGAGSWLLLGGLIWIIATLGLSTANLRAPSRAGSLAALAHAPIFVFALIGFLLQRDVTWYSGVTFLVLGLAWMGVLTVGLLHANGVRGVLALLPGLLMSAGLIAALNVAMPLLTRGAVEALTFIGWIEQHQILGTGR
jgi:hypothetical protein